MDTENDSTLTTKDANDKIPIEQSDDETNINDNNSNSNNYTGSKLKKKKKKKKKSKQNPVTESRSETTYDKVEKKDDLDEIAEYILR